MKYLNATFVNYIGFYNGMNLTEVNIDLTKCKHNVILISGRNGSGKSTLLDHLNPFPDGSNCFIPNKSAEKRLVLANEGDIYTIQIFSPADLKGRKTTKAYIQKNGFELNDNGNVSTYKDIIFSEFDLDPNYISLSRLSNTDRGLGSKTPAERKRFASNIIDNLEVYNAIYKTLNKKSLVYKANINNLHTKIQNIGDKTLLNTRLKQLQSKEAELNSTIMNYNNQIVSIQAKNSIDEEEAIRIKTITDKANNLKKQIDIIVIQLDSFYHKTKIDKDSISDKFNSDSSLLSTYQSKLLEITNIWKDKSNRLKDISDNIITIEVELNNTDTKSDIGERYKNSKNIISEIVSDLNSLSISTDTSILELDKLITFCEKFSQMIDKFNDNLTPKDIDYIINLYDNISLTDMIDSQNSLISKINDNKETLLEIQSKIKVLAILENRPSQCKIDSCAFISEAIELKKSLKTDLIEDLSIIQEENLQLAERVTEIQSKIDYHNSLTYKKMELDSIRSLISENSSIIMKYYSDFYANYEKMILNLNSFGEIRDHTRITNGINLLKMLQAETQNYNLLEVEYNGYKEKIQLLNSSRAMLDKLKNEENDLINYISELKSEMEKYKSLIDSLNSNIETESVYYTTYTQYLELEKEYLSVQKEVDEYQKKSSKALESLSYINELRTNIDKLSLELDPIMKEISTISGQLTLLDSYYEEYNNYKQSYDMIETLKKYCSPTSGGIQTLFMQIYMSKTKILANEILSMLFGGAYQLGDFVINENEFRIPFIGEGLPVDDISSGSGAQIAMMGMIINLVLLHQASTKFNIAQLDEVNGALDSYNNSQFVNVLLHCMNILSIEQLFIISHSTETDNTFADIIKLRGYDNYESNYQSGNVIWDYDEIIKN